MIIFSFSVGIIYYIYIYIFTFLYEVHFHTLTVLSAFSFTTCVMVQKPLIASPIISLVTGKNEYEITALMKKASIIFKQKI